MRPRGGSGPIEQGPAVRHEDQRLAFLGEETGLFYTSEMVFPRQTDVQVATLDDPGALPMTAQIQLADRIGWMEGVDALPGFERYPG